ncbi:hypothetical protein BLNAU_9588 [Blattamonas nauphoetae]|uniref:Uncharacterized protein n=1 Tax=Blattamonas nauphoetae TaxID=2049346 RepID=A0ABQ9XVN9_9EUKA|nr:hypothetical protein BLNAU_9588 [Blattamonas nauphoetae]
MTVSKASVYHAPIISNAFLDWNGNADFSIEAASIIFTSLVTLVKDGHPFNDTLVTKAVDFLQTLSPYNVNFEADTLLLRLVPDHVDPVTGFIEAFWSLLASSEHRIVESTLDVLESTLTRCSSDNRMKMLNCDVIPGVMNILQPHTLSLPLERSLHHRVMRLLKTVHYSTNIPEFFDVSGSSRQSQMNDAIFEQVLIPSEAYLRSLCSNRYFVLEGEQMDSLLELFVCLIEISAFHSPTCTFVVSLPISLTVTSLSTFNSEFEKRFFSNLRWLVPRWINAGPRTFAKGRTILRALNSEGLDDVLDQTLFALKPDRFLKITHSYENFASYFGANNLKTFPR